MGLYDYMTPEELEYAKESAQIDNEALKFEHQFQILALEHESRINDIDTHALLDNYTEAVLEDAYAAELRVYEEGVKEAWEKFKAWLTSVINAILGKKTVEASDVSEEDKKKKVKLPFDLKEVKEKLTSIPGAIKKIFTNDEGDPDGAKIAAALGITAAVGGLIGWINSIKKGEKETEVTVNDAVSNIPFITKIINDIKSLLGQLKEKPGIEKILTAVTKFGGWIKDTINTAVSAVTGAAQKVKEKATVAASKVAPNRNNGKADDITDPTEVGEATNDLISSIDDISFYEESASIDLIMETVSEEDMKEIDSLLESL